MIDHCLCEARIRREKKLYRSYMADGLKAISETLANKMGGSELVLRYSELLDPPKQETRDGDAIIDEISGKFRALGGDGSEPV